MLAALMAVAAASTLLAFGAVTFGYITTRAALEKSQSDVNLSLAAFQQIFDEFSDPWDDGPFADGARCPRNEGPGPMPPGPAPDGPPPGPAPGGNRPPGGPGPAG